jgi:hypothetical protein
MEYHSYLEELETSLRRTDLCNRCEASQKPSTPKVFWKAKIPEKKEIIPQREGLLALFKELIEKKEEQLACALAQLLVRLRLFVHHKEYYEEIATGELFHFPTADPTETTLQQLHQLLEERALG